MNIEEIIRFVYPNQTDEWYWFSEIACEFREKLMVMCYCVQVTK